MELKRLESPAPAAVIMEGVVGAFCDDEDAGLGNRLDFFGDGVNNESCCCDGYIDVSKYSSP